MTNMTKAEINVTPMIDVLLVLLIIFMVLTPHTIGLDARVPGSSLDAGQSAPGEIVITVNGGGAIHLNEEAVPAANVASRLANLYRNRGNVTIFVRADPDLSFEPVAQLIDTARGVGLLRVALMR